MVRFTSGHALLIGVGEYQNSKWNAPITVADAQAVAEALKNPTVSAYPPGQVRLLAGAQATHAGVTVALKQLADQVGKDDTVTIFFCGHGALGTDGTYYFATYETDFTGGKIQAGTGLSSHELLDLLRAIKAQKLLFIINACFSGHLGPTLGAAESPSQTLGAPPSAALGVEVLATGEGRALITASRPSQYSRYLRDQQRTFFGQALADGLRGQGVANSGGYIGLYELYQHIYTNVKQAAAPYGGQEPMLTILQGVGPFPVALYPGATPGDLSTAPIQQTPPLGTAVEIVPHTTVQAIGRGAQAFNIQSEGAVTTDQSHKGIDFGSGHTFSGSVTISGDVAGRDIIKINVSAADAAKVDTKNELLDLIGKLQAEVASLKNAPEGEREDATDELRKAKDAGEKGDKKRMVQKLESAQKIMLALASSVPAALKLGETIGAVLQRAISLFT